MGGGLRLVYPVCPVQGEKDLRAFAPFARRGSACWLYLSVTRYGDVTPPAEAGDIG